jgi:hypothetical protein
LVLVVKKPIYTQTLERLHVLRNFAAHESPQSELRVKEILGISRLASAGSWLKSPDRFLNLSEKLKALAVELEAEAPY